MGCCGSKGEKPAPTRQVVVAEASSITAGQTPSKDREEDSTKEREPEIELDAHLEALANNMDFVSTVLQSSFVSENESLREQFDLALKETTPEEIDEANDTYFTAAEQETALQKFGFISGPIAPEGEQRRFNWQKGELLGVGAFGRVYMGLDTDTGQMLAVKQVTLGGHASSRQFMEQMRSLETEISLLRPLNHPNIVRCYGCERDHEELNIFLELVPGGSITSLLQKFGPFAEPMVAVYTKQILTGLEYLHANRIIHRDIKGANILVDSDGVVKLADFGASKQIQNVMSATGDLHSLKGTPYWMAPEVIKQTGHGRQADIWSVGCTVIEMLTGKPPWVQFNTQVSALFHIASSKEPPSMPADVTSTCRTFLLQTFARCGLCTLQSVALRGAACVLPTAFISPSAGAVAALAFANSESRHAFACRDPKLRPNASRLLQHDFVRDVAGTQIRHTSSGFDSPNNKAQDANAPPAADLGLALQDSFGASAAADSLHASSTGDVLQSIEEVQEPPTPLGREGINGTEEEATVFVRRRSNASDTDMGAGNEKTINQWLSLQASETDALSKMLIAQSPNNVAATATREAGAQPGLPIVVETINGTISDGDTAAAATSGGLPPGDIVSPEQIQADTAGSAPSDPGDDRPIQTIGTHSKRTQPSQNAMSLCHAVSCRAS